MHKHTVSKFISGITLIETLIALFLFTVGILGTYKLQLISEKQVHSNYLRTLAMIYVHDLFERMESNITAANSGVYATASGKIHDICYTSSGCSNSMMGVMFLPD